MMVLDFHTAGERLEEHVGALLDRLEEQAFRAEGLCMTPRYSFMFFTLVKRIGSSELQIRGAVHRCAQKSDTSLPSWKQKPTSDAVSGRICTISSDTGRHVARRKRHGSDRTSIL